MTNKLRLPNNWEPRDYQKPAWNAWIRDEETNHLELIWHRRAGKDDVALHGACIKAHRRKANYWHMLPQHNQVRKAIWDAVNPRTGIRRIDEAFPRELRENTRDNDMLIRFKNGSSWQCLGSDNFQNAIGSTPAGIVYSEWSQANPSVRGYLRPILTENNGYQVYITTPRGKNHAYKTYRAAVNNPNQFAQILRITDTKTLSAEQLVEELDEYVSTYGLDMGKALFEQEYYCSFDAAILGAFYASEFSAVDRHGRICVVPHDPEHKVHVAMDIGRTDDTAIYWYQFIAGDVRIIDFYQNHGKDPVHYCSQMEGRNIELDFVSNKLIVTRGDAIEGLERRRAYNYGRIHLPHDAKAKSFAAVKSTQEQFAAIFGWSKICIVPAYSFEDGIQAVRFMFPRVFFDESLDQDETQNGIEPLRQYHRDWDDDKKMFKAQHAHDWCSHAADAFRYLAVSWIADTVKESDAPISFPVQGTFKDMLKIVKKRRMSS